MKKTLNPASRIDGRIALSRGSGSDEWGRGEGRRVGGEVGRVVVVKDEMKTERKLYVHTLCVGSDCVQ